MIRRTMRVLSALVLVSVLAGCGASSTAGSGGAEAAPVGGASSGGTGTSRTGHAGHAPTTGEPANTVTTMSKESGQ